MGMMLYEQRGRRFQSHRANPQLLEVVKVVRALLRSGDRVFRVGRRFESVCRRGSVQMYTEEVLDIRVGKSGVLLQIRLPYCSRWSTVWSSEDLVAGTGEILYRSPDFEELERQLSTSFDDLMDDFMDEFGILPWNREVA